MKAYTDLEQSKNLAKILPLESADMSWDKEFDSGRWLISLVKYTSWIVPRYSYNKIEDRILPCWSLAALIEVLPKGTNVSTPKPLNESSYCCWNQQEEIFADNPVDACVEMIIKLHDQKLL